MYYNNNKSLISLLNLQNLKEKNNIIENEPMSKKDTLQVLDDSYINEIRHEFTFNKNIRIDTLIRSISI